jgi:hypothetical protein
MNATNKEPEPQEIEALLPWYAAGTLSPRTPIAWSKRWPATANWRGNMN